VEAARLPRVPPAAATVQKKSSLALAPSAAKGQQAAARVLLLTSPGGGRRSKATCGTSRTYWIGLKLPFCCGACIAPAPEILDTRTHVLL